jgi:hypothetical protein
LQFLNLQGATPNGVACYECVVVYIASDSSFQSAQTNCTTDARPPLGFNGTENSMILSRYPLQNTDIWVLPATLYRRSVLYAQVQLEDQSFDFYCGFLITTLNYQALPYDGSYGNGQTDSLKAWSEEQLLEAKQVQKFVQKKSGTDPNTATPAIVVGEWRSSLNEADAGLAPPPGGNLPINLSENTMLFFQGLAPQWTFATSQDWLQHPQCNFCPTSENLYNGSTDSYFVTQPMLVNWPGNASTATIDESLLYTQSTITLPGDAGLGPVSPYYGLNVRVIRPRH